MARISLVIATIVILHVNLVELQFSDVLEDVQNVMEDISDSRELADPAECKDQMKQTWWCNTFKSYCANPKWKNMEKHMKKYCKKTCGRCPVPTQAPKSTDIIVKRITGGTCADAHYVLTRDKCRGMAAKDKVLTFKDEENGDWPYGCYQYRKTKIYFNKKENKVQCDKNGVVACFCGNLPGPTPAPPACEDKEGSEAYCKRNEGFCFDTVGGGHLQEKCKNTCGNCPVTTSDYDKKTSGTCTKSLTVWQCRKVADIIGIHSTKAVRKSSGAPRGCSKGPGLWGPEMFYNNASETWGRRNIKATCSADRPCYCARD